MGSEDQFTVYIRVHGRRGDFVDPQPVDWDDTKQAKLWRILSGTDGSTGSLDWTGLARSLNVPLDFLLQQSSWLYQRQLRNVQEQIRQLHMSSRTSDSPRPEPQPSQAGPAIHLSPPDPDTMSRTSVQHASPERFSASPQSHTLNVPAPSSLSPPAKSVNDDDDEIAFLPLENATQSPAQVAASGESSFSDISETSVSQVALEEAYLSDVRRGISSRMSNVSAILKSRYF
ncbi:hypothetical protein CANCADRAFT_147545 [Tortispora caseinolytica NRRL Y-17796]|uniref:Autophagy-related protein 29 n=1 Tax=Tortispora caseinolytica NRRL Y-17796 TaxID=767744 RepID=A0A1E4TKD4_9ASCO|nr:hypothetical protein CANCADRAFT_147545 [Tortispora caseinolytica NRRL Y-17796]